MNPRWMPSHLGAEPKKLATLGGLVVLLGVVYWMNMAPGGAPSPTSLPIASQPIATPVTAPRPMPFPDVMPARRRSQANNGAALAEDFRPTLKLPEGFDVSAIDPALRL